MIPKLSKILILTVCLASVSLADDFKTVDGKEYKNAKVSRVEPDGIVITFSGGIVKLPFAELSPEVQKRYGFDPIAEEKRRAEQEALEDKQVEEQKAVAREQAEGEKNAEADLTQSREQSQAAEQRAAQTYRSAPKGTLSGQVFVSARGRENFKLGAVQVTLFGRDAMDILLAGLKRYADIKIQQLNGLLGVAQANLKQAEANEQAARTAEQTAFNASLNLIGSGNHAEARRALDVARAQSREAREARRAAENQYSEIKGELAFYYSGAFLLRFSRIAHSDSRNGC